LGKQGGASKKSRSGRDVGIAYFVTGIRCDTGQR
jgi:hypothetical protein